jgi:hypothetical protein
MLALRSNSGNSICPSSTQILGGLGGALGKGGGAAAAGGDSNGMLY